MFCLYLFIVEERVLMHPAVHVGLGRVCVYLPREQQVEERGWLPPTAFFHLLFGLGIMYEAVFSVSWGTNYLTPNFP